MKKITTELLDEISNRIIKALKPEKIIRLKLLNRAKFYMDEAKKKEIRQWMIKAIHDLGSAKRLTSGTKPFLDTAVYHWHQAAEKALKAYLTFQDTDSSNAATFLRILLSPLFRKASIQAEVSIRVITVCYAFS